MQSIYTIETNPDTFKQMRVEWNEIGDKGDSHGHNWAEYGIRGTGEDGSTWDAWTQGDELSDSWSGELEDIEMSDGEGTETQMGINAPFRGYTGHWTLDGRIIKTSHGRPLLKTEDYFKETLGDFPNIDPRKGNNYIKNEKYANENPRIRHQRVIGDITHHSWSQDESEFHKKFKTIKDNGKDVLIASDYGLLHDFFDQAYRFLERDTLGEKSLHKNHGKITEMGRFIAKHLL